jgi:hypothetical protein
MYEKWLCKRWETPVSDRPMSMVSLTDADGLEIVVNASRTGEQPRRYKFLFKKPAGYRNLPEEYRTELWGKFSKSSHPGSTFIVESSPWIAEIAVHEPLLMVHDRGVVHYVIATDDDVVEILSSQPPTISRLNE